MPSLSLELVWFNCTQTVPNRQRIRFQGRFLVRQQANQALSAFAQKTAFRDAAGSGARKGADGAIANETAEKGLWVLPRYWKTGMGMALIDGTRHHPCEERRESERGRRRHSPRVRTGQMVRLRLHLDLGGACRPSLMCPRTRADVVGASTGRVVEVQYSSQCPWSGWMIDGIRNHLGRLDVEVRMASADDRAVTEEYGLTRGVCVDGRPVITRLAPGTCLRSETPVVHENRVEPVFQQTRVYQGVIRPVTILTGLYASLVRKSPVLKGSRQNQGVIGNSWIWVMHS